MTYEEACAARSETAKYRSLTTQYCQGNGVDIASGGDPVVPWAIQIELSPEDYAFYNSNHPPRSDIQWKDSKAIWDLPFKDETLDFIYSSHLIEDYLRESWLKLFREWTRVLKPGGHMVILVPEVERWNYAITKLGQCPNCAHKYPEPHVGEVSEYASRFGMKTIRDSLTAQYPYDYSILHVSQKP